jgi:hypothetical protein
MPEDEDDRARAERCLQLAREASSLENRLGWVTQAEFWFSLAERYRARKAVAASEVAATSFV